VLKTAEDFEDLAWEYFVRAHADGVRHAEIFFDPQAHTSRGVDIGTIVRGITAARTRAKKEFGITSLLIACFLRHLPVPSCLETLTALTPYFDSGDILGIGLDSSELPFPPKLFRELYDHPLSAQAKLIRTAHAGEEGPPSYIEDALNILNVSRIDHGIRAVEDVDLLQRLSKENIMLTVCPLSNVKLKNAKTIADVPLQKFLEYNVPFSINSDDPAYFGGYCLANYCAVQEAFDWGVQEWVTIARNGIEGSWIDSTRKTELLQELAEAKAEWEKLNVV